MARLQWPAGIKTLFGEVDVVDAQTHHTAGARAVIWQGHKDGGQGALQRQRYAGGGQIGIGGDAPVQQQRQQLGITVLTLTELLLQDRRIAADADLPATGVPLPLERALSAVFVALPDYGTRASSVVRLSVDHVEFAEQGFDANGPLQARHLRAELAPKV